MARYWVVEESANGGVAHGPFEGLTVAKAMGQKMASRGAHAVVIRSEESPRRGGALRTSGLG